MGCSGEAPPQESQEEGGPGWVDEPAEAQDHAWEQAGETSECQVDALFPAHVGVRRVKNLLTGLPPTDGELRAVQDDPSALRGYVSEWIQSPEFDVKLEAFLTASLQQAQLGRDEYVVALADAEGIAGFNAPDELWDALNSSFTRTAMYLIEQGRPFSEISSTRTWMMTTAMMAYMLHLDRFEAPEVTFYHEPFTRDGVDFDASTPRDVQLEHAVFHSTQDLSNADNNCSDPYDVRPRNQGGNRPLKRTLFTTFVLGRAPNTNGLCTDIRMLPFSDSDFEDWRPVTIVSPGADARDRVAFYDTPSLRGMDELPLEVERAGFFTTPSFLAGWRTNEENSFRVTTNQTLIVGLGLAFEDSDSTTPLGDDGLAEDHAAPTTQCYACHKNLDPMRNFFDVVFKPDTYTPRALADRPDVEPSFSFQGYSEEGTTLPQLGRILSEHPYFATAWTQKLCVYANSTRCDEDDPEFARVVAAFEDSGHDFEVLLVELFSSSLVTNATCASGKEGERAVVSVSRFEHLCQTLGNRLGRADICSESSSILDLATALPAEAWPRGSDVPAQPTEPSLFYAAGETSWCKEIAALAVDANGSRLQSSDMGGSLDYIVETVMGVVPSDPRHADVHEIMSTHIERASEVDGDPAAQLRSAFVAACTSPYVTSTDL